ncbi:hypothetical protein BH09ACT4_BH09ACT4_22260 [soil metagenome]
MAKRDLGDVAVTALTRPGIGSALLAGLGVYMVLVGQAVLNTFAFIATDDSHSQDVWGFFVLILRAGLPVTLGAPLPFAIGVVLSFWQLAPVVPQLRMAHVVTRSLLAAVVGAVATFLIGVLVALFVGADAILGNPHKTLAASVHQVLPGALSLLIAGLVVVPLAALLLWGWLQAHPPKRTAAGVLDEV